MTTLMLQNCRLKTHFAADLIEHMRDTGHDLQDPSVNCPECKSKVPMSEIEDHYAQCIQGLCYSVARFQIEAENLKYKFECFNLILTTTTTYFKEQI